MFYIRMRTPLIGEYLVQCYTWDVTSAICPNAIHPYDWQQADHIWSYRPITHATGYRGGRR